MSDSVSPQTDYDSNIAIDVADISKCYLIYEQPLDRLKQVFANRWNSIARKLTPQKPPKNFYREFWALRNISIKVQKGEAVGIIGRNGAGKSTLLQIVAGTLTPTSGNIKVIGKVAALLELGSGFSMDFTGRENVYLNASILGLTKDQTDAKYEEIAAFADIGDFIEQPVKTYSTGMMVRLAFAIQTAVEPEILIVDEALAVGDMFFQAKCMSRLRHLMASGTTVLFVSHDIGTVRQFCSEAVFIADGKILDYGPVQRVTDHYQRQDYEERNLSVESMVASLEKVNRSDYCEDLDTVSRTIDSDSVHELACIKEGEGLTPFQQIAKEGRTGNGSAIFLNVQILRDGVELKVFNFGDLVTLRQVVLFQETLNAVNVCYKIRTPQAIEIVFADTRLTGDITRIYEKGKVYVFEWEFRLDLLHGSYTVLSALTRPPFDGRSDWTYLDVIPNCLVFQVAPRKDGMIDGFVVWDNHLSIHTLTSKNGT